VKVQAFHAGDNAPVVGAQGQAQIPLYWDENLPGAQASAVQIVMPPGTVSNPHVHLDIQVQVVLLTGYPGVATFWGDELENVTWVSPGGILAIQPGVPHIALYPRARADVPRREPDALGIEIRNTPDYRDDVTARPELWPLAFAHAVRIDIADRLTWPDHVTVTGGDK